MATAGDVQGLGYFAVHSPNLAGWREFGSAVLGLAAVPQAHPDRLRFRVDDYPWRIEILGAAEEKLGCVGWQVPNAEALERTTRRVEACGMRVTALGPAQTRDRRVRAAVQFNDPSGIPVELFLAPSRSTAPFVSPYAVRFVTGPLGLGHLVLRVGGYRESVEFYRLVMGFGVSDELTLGDTHITFLHCNGRHHSLALASAPAGVELLHFMLEVETLDEVGYAFDRCEKHGVELVKTIGRHSNDRMISFYARSPSGFEVEYGCDGLVIDPASWAVRQLEAPSVWGHRLLVARRWR